MQPIDVIVVVVVVVVVVVAIIVVVVVQPNRKIEDFCSFKKNVAASLQR